MKKVRFEESYDVARMGCEKRKYLLEVFFVFHYRWVHTLVFELMRQSDVNIEWVLHRSAQEASLRSQNQIVILTLKLGELSYL